MFTALLSFLGGSAFRMIWGEMSAFITKRQEHAQELDRLRLQGELDAAAHARNLQALQLQAQLGVQTIEVQRDADLARLETDAWGDMVRSLRSPTGIAFLDFWNGAIHPLLATLAIAVVVAQIAANGFVLSDWDKELVAAILGLYVADRRLAKRGK